MKKILLIAAMALLTIAAGAQTVKIGHVNSNELLYLMPEADSVRSQMNAINKETQDTYQSMMDEFQSKYSQYQQKSSTWTQAIKDSKEKELSDIQSRIQEFEQNAQQDLNAQQQKLMAPLSQKVQNTINTLAKAKGVTVVFDDASLLFVDKANTVDLTPDARKALNIAEGRTLESLQKEIQAQQPAQATK